jgi:membrane protease YdiL (CAAX protease family)
MPKPIEDPVLIAYQTRVMLVSLGVGVALLGLRFRGPLLRFQPRKLVPWNAAGAILAVLLVSFAVLSAFAPQNEREKNAHENAASQADESAQAEFRITVAIVEQIVIVGGMLFLAVVYFDANRDDLGLPANVRELGKDICIGIVAGLGAIAPVFLVMLILSGPEMKSGHPLVKMLSEGGPDLPVFILSSLVAVVVAPICEEITFRLFLQGWLEKCEATLRGMVRQNPTSDVLVPSENSQAAAHGLTGVEFHVSESQPVVDPTPAYDVAPSTLSQMLVDTPHGWVAIVISAAFFGLAHLGYGPEPIPLFFLALVLGYLYNRTHRIVPSMVAHALFNAYTMIALWRMVFYDHINMQ